MREPSFPRPSRGARVAALLTFALSATACVAEGYEEGIETTDQPLASPTPDVGGFALVGFGGGGKCLDIAGGSGEFDNGRSVQMWSCYGNANQRWVYVDGEIRGLGGKCLDSVGTGNGARIQTYDCWGGGNQRWRFENGQIKNPDGRCLDIAGGAGEQNDGARVQIYDCIGSPNQRWDVRPVTNAPARSPGYQNPVYGGDFPDPFVLPWNGRYYAFSTNGGGMNVRVIESQNLSGWSAPRDAFPNMPGWTVPSSGLTWAPGVWARGDGAFILYYTARSRSLGLQCIGRAVAWSPAGPYRDDFGGPLVCQTNLGGSIDASPFVDANGTPFLAWKNDGNSSGKPIGIWSQQLARDGLSLVGGASRLIGQDQAWEAPLIEGPSMIRNGGRFVLTYSGNWWEGSDYGVGYAVCDGPLGPCRKPQNGPILHKADLVAGPGGQEFFRAFDGGLWMAYHAWTYPNTSNANGARSLRIDPVVFAGDTPVIVGPSAQRR